MKKSCQFNQNQLLALMSLMLLSPALRLFPNAAAEAAAQAGALTAFAALPFIMAYLCFICSFMSRRHEGEGLSELSMRALGATWGKAALILESSWMLLYSGFILRCSADRMMTTIYPYASPAVFISVMSFICLTAALCSPVCIVRTAKLMLPAVFGVLLFILLFGIFSVDSENLLPLSSRDFFPVLKGSLGVIDILTVILSLSCFFISFMPRGNGSFKDCSIWVLLMLFIIAALCTAVIGSFGAALTVRLSWPFFSFVRSLVFFHTLERTEAFVVAIWTFPDFLLVSMLIYSASYSLRLAMGINSPACKDEKLLSMERKRWVIPLCSFFSLILALVIAKEPETLELWSRKLIPSINLIFSLIFIPGIYIAGIIKKKL